eukprot:1380947-Amorphochlora_amoeboformis.AAC.2
MYIDTQHPPHPVDRGEKEKRQKDRYSLTQAGLPSFLPLISPLSSTLFLQLSSQKISEKPKHRRNDSNPRQKIGRRMSSRLRPSIVRVRPVSIEMKRIGEGERTGYREER